MKDQAAWFITPAQQTQQALESWRASASVSRFQAKTALDEFGYLDQVEAQMKDPETPKQTKRSWAEDQEFRRESPIMAQIAGALGLTEDEIDKLFQYAESIKA